MKHPLLLAALLALSGPALMAAPIEIPNYDPAAWPPEESLLRETKASMDRSVNCNWRDHILRSF